MKRDTEKCTFLHFFKNVRCIIGVDIEEGELGNFVGKRGYPRLSGLGGHFWGIIFHEISLKFSVLFLGKVGEKVGGKCQKS